MPESESPIMSGPCYRFVSIMVNQKKAGRPVPQAFVKWIAQALGVWEELISHAIWLEENTAP